MGTIKSEAQAYKPKATKNIADLPAVTTDLQIEDDSFEVEKDGKTKVVKTKVIVIDGEKYRCPDSVLRDLKSILEEKPDLKTFKVKRSGSGLDTSYTVIPL